MNELSMLLYFGGVAGNLGPLFVISGFICLCLSGIGFVISVAYSEYGNTAEEDQAVRKQARRYAAWSLPIAIVLFFCGAFTPDKNTVYAMAASQMGEKALKTPIAHKAEQALESWLNKQIETNTKPDTPAVQKSD